MPKRKYPEQRSTTAASQPGQAPAHPSGNEVFDEAAPTAPPRAEAELTEEELAELRDLRHALAEAYAEAMHATGRVADHAAVVVQEGKEWIRNHPSACLVSAYAAGIVLGYLSDRT